MYATICESETCIKIHILYICHKKLGLYINLHICVAWNINLFLTQTLHTVGCIHLVAQFYICARQCTYTNRRVNGLCWQEVISILFGYFALTLTITKAELRDIPVLIFDVRNFTSNDKVKWSLVPLLVSVAIFILFQSLSEKVPS